MRRCLDDNEILAFVEGNLGASERGQVEIHVARCVVCCELLAGAARAMRGPSDGAAILGAYALSSVVGYGATSIVYRARSVADGRVVALKTVRMRSPAFLAGMRREIAALERLRHPGIVRVLDHGVDDGRPWYAMELLEGDTLASVRRRLHRGAGAPRIACGGELRWVLTLAGRLCDALAYLHGQGLVHRDLKPENVFLRQDGQPVLLDFGLSRTASGARAREATEAPLADGTPAYVAPEQIRGEQVDARADLYSLGCMLYELVAGRPPFVGEDVDGVLRKHLHEAPDPVGAIVGGVPGEVESLVARLLAKSPWERPGQAWDVASALRDLLPGGAGGHETSGECVPTVYRASLVGRDARRDSLRAMVEAMRDGYGGGIATVFGESGIGKTFLVNEVARACRGVQIFEGSCLPPEASREQGPVLAPFHGLLEVVADRCQTLGERERRRLLGDRGAVLGELNPRLRTMGGPGTSPAPPQGAAARERLIEALRETLALLAEERPVLLLLDDLHWADDLTLRFLESFTAAYFERHRVLILATCRTEEKPPAVVALLERAFVTAVVLGRLDDVAVESIVTGMLGCAEAPVGLAPTLARHAEGNPFFVSEYVRAAVAHGLLERREGRWSVAVSPGAWPLPGSLRALVGARLTSLSPEARRYCESAAVFGQELSLELLELGGDATDAGRAVEELVAREILCATDGSRLRFVHHKIREVAYASLEPSRRRALHRAAAEWSEAQDATEETRRFGWLAEQWTAADEPRRGQHYFERAGDHALRVGAYRQAAWMFERALSLETSATVREGPAPAERRAHWNLGLGRARFGTGDLDGLEEHAMEALDLLGWKRPRHRRDWGMLLLRELAGHLGRLASPALRTPRECVPGLQDAALAAGLLGQRYFYLDDLVPVVATALLAMNAAERAGTDPVPRAYTVMAGLTGLARLRGTSRRYFQRAHEAAGADASERAMAFAVDVVVAGSLAEWPRAAEAGARLGACLPGVRDPLVRGIVLSTLRHAEIFAGRHDAARERASELLALGQANDNAQHVMWARYYLARSLLREGRHAEGAALLEKTLERLRAHKELQSEINCLGSLALARAGMGQAEEARALADRALTGIDQSRPTGFPSLDGYCAVAEVYRALRRRSSTTNARELDARWMVARRALWKLAALYPVGLPAALRESGLAHLTAGRPRRGHLLLVQSGRLAARFGMADDQTVAETSLRSDFGPAASEFSA